MTKFRVVVEPPKVANGKSVVRLHRKDPKYRTLLSIDGGGAKAVIPITVLNHFEECLKDVLQEESEECRKIPKEDMVVNVGDCFDTISGNSSGSIVGLYIASGGGNEKLYEEGNLLHGKGPGTMDAAQLLVKNKLPEIFDRRIWAPFWVQTKYREKGLEKALKDMFGDLSMKDLVSNVYIPAFELNNRRGVGFYHQNAVLNRGPYTGYAYCNDVESRVKSGAGEGPSSLISKNDVNVPVWLVAKCSASAPTYFPVTTWKDDNILSKIGLKGEGQWADGGMVSNNPSMQALAFMGAAFASADKNCLLKIENMAVMSIGTGRSKKAVKVGGPFNVQGILGWKDELVKAPMELHDVINSRILDAFFDGVSFGGRTELDRYVRVNKVVDPEQKEFKTLGDLDSTSKEDIENFEAIGKSAAEDFDKDMRKFLRDVIFVEAE